MPEAARAPRVLPEDYDAFASSPRPRHLEAVPERRTVRITGQPTPARPRSSRTTAGIRARPDRVVLWAFLLGLFLVFMAVATANASTF